MKRFGKFGLMTSIMVLPIFTSSDKNEIPDMEDFASKMQDKTVDQSEILKAPSSRESLDAYNERMIGVFEDMFNLCYI